MYLDTQAIIIDNKKTGFFRFKKLNGKYLLTNDHGGYSYLEPAMFQDFLSGTIKTSGPSIYDDLRAKAFIRNESDFDGITQKYAAKNDFLKYGTSLHIVVVTLRCDHSCIYCQTRSRSLTEKNLDMSIETARSVVERIFEATNDNTVIEFQGGEPLVNFDIIKYIVRYARKKNRTFKKKLLFSCVSNFNLLTKDKLSFLLRNNVALCTSLDGPAKLHNANRIKVTNDSYKSAVKWLKIIRRKTRKGSYKYRVNALTTLTRYSIRYPKAIIDEFLSLGLEGVHLRPVSPFGIDVDVWNKINIPVDDFKEFYRQALDYILELNKKNTLFYERTAKIFLTKILSPGSSDYLDLRSPCGAGIGQLAYNFNGDVYTCDEGRMMSRLGSELFRLGDVFQNNHQDYMRHDGTKALAVASCLDNLPGCNECVYKPYCGSCPIYNYVLSGDIFKSAYNDRCRINTYILDCIFELLQDEKNKRIFLSWVNN